MTMTDEDWANVDTKRIRVVDTRTGRILPHVFESKAEASNACVRWNTAPEAKGEGAPFQIRAI